ncbi:hypothetical protein BJV82DRAFT_617767 [Fennellomyces sp. T-0311]|nr:hypothetical protein BJV82DRAFT_617767 [Fennellomyces sp. T-0311]
MLYPPPIETTRWKTIGRIPFIRFDGRQYRVSEHTFSKYQVSDMGHVRLKSDSRIMTPAIGHNGNPRVVLFEDEMPDTRPKPYDICFLVALVFIDGFSYKTSGVWHINGNKMDNRAENLKWILKQYTELPKWKEISEVRMVKVRREQQDARSYTFSNFEVSTNGQVRRKGAVKALKQTISSEGKPRVKIFDDKDPRKRKAFDVSRLVACTFVDGYSFTHSSVVHINGDKLDNYAENLKWAFNKQLIAEYKKHHILVRPVLDQDDQTQRSFPNLIRAKRFLTIGARTLPRVNKGESYRDPGAMIFAEYWDSRYSRKVLQPRFVYIRVFPHSIWTDHYLLHEQKDTMIEQRPPEINFVFDSYVCLLMHWMLYIAVALLISFYCNTR